MKKQLFNTNWLFSKTIYDERLLDEIPENWDRVELPHDWLIYNTENLYEDSIGWYKRNLFYHKDDMKWLFRFEAVYMNSSVYLNGKKIFDWKNGYSTFDVDVTPYLEEGDNEILVRVLHQSPNSRWYSGAGIYRNVWLIKLPASHIVPDGIYITPEKKNGIWSINIDTEIKAQAVTDFICHTIIDPEGKEIQTKRFSLPKLNLGENSSHIITNTMTVDNPKLWSVGQGNVYKLKTQLFAGQEIIDEDTNAFGFRTIEFSSDKGFLLNGEAVKIKGACEHHGFGCLGAIVNKSAIKRKLTILKKMGVNAIRTAHNMPSVEFMELADEMGFLVDSEAFDMWGQKKTEYDYGRFFSEWYKKDVASWIRRDRNHPSIIMWSVGNEIYDMHAGKEGYGELAALICEVKKHDPKGHAKTTFASNYMRWENAQKCAELVDLVGYNYGEALYDEHHRLHPEWIIYGSETASMLASRGVYHFPADKNILCEDDEQCSALGNSFAGWGAHNYLENIIADRDRKFSLGQFVWSGFDYFGEPTPYHTRNSYFGQIDTAGFPKDSFYIYQAEWTDYRDNPMIHIFPYWDYNEGQEIDVCVCSNAPEVELLLNGRSCGRKSFDHVSGRELTGHWRLPYEKGELVAYAYDENGNVIATDVRRSFSDAYGIEIKSEQTCVNTDTNEFLFLEASLYDKAGNPVENGNNRIYVRVEGPASIAGIDNGDSTDFEQVKSDNKRMFNGKMLVVIKPHSGAVGEIKVTMSSDSLVSSSYVCKLIREGQDEISKREIPIRKIELSCKEGTALSKERDTAIVSYKIYPSNATYSNLEWKIVNDIGIELNTAAIKVENDRVIISAKGDGKFHLRCNAFNGRKVANVRSTLAFEVNGMGRYIIDPYERNYTGICINRPDGLGEGEDHGVRFLGRENTKIYFEYMDFGRYGADSFEAEIFKYMKEPVSFKIYELTEEQNKKENEQLILDTSFGESANWMEFKKKVYRLSNKIKGVKKICIESADNFQLKSFRFIPVCHGFEKIYANEADEIFGDQYTILENMVEKIGNNTTLTFENMNFGDNSPKSIILCGKSKQKNTIHLKIETNEKTHLELIEFPASEEFAQKEFSITPFNEAAKISFVFLPGSDFDFSWFMLKK